MSSHIACLKRPVVYRRKRYAIRLGTGVATTTETNIVKRETLMNWVYNADGLVTRTTKVGEWPRIVNKLHATKGWRTTVENHPLER